MTITADALGQVPLFSGLREKERKSLAKRMHEKTYQPGDVIVEEGSPGIGFSILVEGTAEVTIGGEVRRQLRAGDHFGELALLDPDTGRQATVRATSELKCASMTAWEFKPLLRENPDMAFDIMRRMARMLAETESHHRQAASA